MKNFALVSLLILFLLCPILAADDGPVAFLTEDIISDYSQAWGNRTPISMLGTVEVFVPNTVDVLQYVRINITNVRFDLGIITDLLTNTTYRNYAESSGGLSDKTLMFTNTSLDGTTAYNITSADAARPLQLNASVINYQGGSEVYSADNIEEGLWGKGNNTVMIWVTVSNPSGTNGINPTTLTVKIKNCTVEDNFGQEVDAGSTAGTASLSQSAYIGTVTVSGIDLGTDGWDTLQFNASIKKGVDYTSSTLVQQFDLDAYVTDNDPSTDSRTTDIGVVGNHSNSTGTASETKLAELFSRGPISQGVEMAPSAGTPPLWSVRGFIENVGDGNPTLNYTFSSWALYNVNETGDVNSTASQSGTALTVGGTSVYSVNNSDGRAYTTWYDTASSAKPYYAPEFVWEVKWNGTSTQDARRESSRINATMGFNTLEEIDLTTDKEIDSAALLRAEEGGINILVREYVQHTGHSSLNVSRINILSEVPAQDGEADTTLWDINKSTVVVRYENAENVFNITIDMNGTGDGAWNLTQDPASGVPGFVNITIDDLSATNVFQNMSVNDKIWLEYYIISPTGGDGSAEVGDTWNFYGNSSLTTIGGVTKVAGHGGQGTPTREENNETLSLAAKKLIAHKTIRAVGTDMPNNLTVTIVLNVSDQSTSLTGISGLKFIDYIPRGTDFTITRPYVRLFNGSWNDLTEGIGQDYVLTSIGNATLPDGSPADAFEYNNSAEDGWNFTDEVALWVNYTFNVTDEGLYTLPTIFAAFDPDTGEGISTRAFAAIVVSMPSATIPLSISEKDLALSQFVTVERPVSWRKDFVVYNPNLKRVSGGFRTEIFMDTLKVHVSYFDEFGDEHKEDIKYVSEGDSRYIEWNSNLNPLETRNYIITVLTPPVIETNKEVIGDVEELEDDLVRVKLDIYLRNTAQENYENVRLHLRTPYDNIEEVSEKGVGMNYWGSGEETTVVEIEKFAAGELKALRVVYIGSYPIIIIKTDRDEYETGMPVGMTILVINGGERVEKPYFQTEVYSPEGDIVRSLVTQGKSLMRLEKDEIAQEFTIPRGSITGMYAANVRFREDYAILATGTSNFSVRGVNETLRTLSYILLIASTLVVLSFSYQRVKRIQKQTMRFA